MIYHYTNTAVILMLNKHYRYKMKKDKILFL